MSTTIMEQALKALDADAIADLLKHFGIEQ